MTEPTPIEPDEKDWTVVIDDGCHECGFQPHDVARTGQLLRDSIPGWRTRLARADVHDRPSPTTWSPLEYGAHVRDVCRVFRERLSLMLEQDDPMFPNWDQDAAAVEGAYHRLDPAIVAAEYAREASATADAFDAVADDEWQRRGLRGGGAHFTVATLAVYFTHDIHHHLHDVRG